MSTASYSVNLNIGGVQMSQIVTRTGDHPNPYEPTLPVASSGTIVNRTNDAMSDVTLLANHGLTNGTYDCFFSTGVKYACEGTISANTMTLTNGSGDAFPANTTACQVSKVTAINTAIDGDAIKIIGICLKATDAASTKVAHVKFMDSTNAEIAEIDLVANVPRVWDVEGGSANPFTGNPITHAEAAQNDTSNTMTLQIISLEDSTP